MSHLVRLKYATTQMFVVGGLSFAYTYIRVKVKNVAFAKDVAAHYWQAVLPPGWADIGLPWIANYGDYDVFGRNDGFVTDQLVVRGSEAGQTDWDNNDWMNYHVPNFHNVVGGNVVLNKAVAKRGMQAGGGFTFDTSWFEGEIYVNNLCYGKRVGVHYTADGGASWDDSGATYAGPVSEGTYASSSGAELWRFRTPELNYNPAAGMFAFAVYFQRLDNWAWYWDNNFGQNYKLSKVDGSTIE